MFRGTGNGSGGNPISSNWQQGMATNVCPGGFAHHRSLTTLNTAEPLCPFRFLL